MARSKRPTSVDELSALVSDLIDHIKVLVTAVDDLRCEVEWWARNAVDERSTRRNAPFDSSAPAAQGDALKPSPTGLHASTSEQLASLERELSVGPIGEWPADWHEEEPPELPTGEVICVDESLWSSVLDYRAAHIVANGCECEDGIGAPFLLAWQNENGCFLRELTEDEAIDLQRVCLATQQEAKERCDTVQIPATQRGLWQD